MAEPEVKNLGGRPTDYTDALAADICSRLSDGQSMRKIAKDDDMPSSATMFNWLRVHSTFLEQYEIAKAECADMYAEEIIEISDDSQNDYIEEDKDGKRLNPENIQRARLKVDARKWVAAKLKPKKYGDRIQQDVNARVVATDMSSDQIDEKILEMQRLLEQSTED